MQLFIGDPLAAPVRRRSSVRLLLVAGLALIVGLAQGALVSAQDAAKDVGKDLLNKELNKLFPGGMPGPGTLFPIPKK